MVADIFMEFLEQSAIAQVLLEYKPKLWKRYVDDILEIIKCKDQMAWHSTSIPQMTSRASGSQRNKKRSTNVFLTPSS